MNAFLGFLFGVVATVGALLGWSYYSDQQDQGQRSSAPTVVPSAPELIREIVDPRPRTPRVVYLNREGAILRAGVDDSTKNVSSIVEHVLQTEIDYPAFASTGSRWRGIVECVQEKLEAFDVVVTDRRPTEPGYIMVMIGGRPSLLGSDNPHVHAAGLSPFHGGVIPDSIVMVFAQEVRHSERETCEAAAQEIAHSYGLDHTYDCRDLMTYRRRCGRARTFVDEDMPCGEHEARDCKPADSGPTQNSHARLMEVLGPRPPPAPAPEE